MVKIQLDLNKEEDRISAIVKAIYNLNDKKEAIKKIIKEYGKNIKVEDKNLNR